MLKLFPGYFLLLGLACQFGHAQRSGGGFSILSESTGPLVAEGNTSTTGFSQIGASEAIQGTFSTATTGFSGTIGFLASQPLNTLPTDLNFTAPLTIAENQPIGTIVGEFNATDPDAGATLTYHLVSGAGDTHNSLFTLDTNGTLKSATVFDYETNASTYSIRVQAKDEHNATVEGNFTVMLTDVYEPSQPNHFVDLNATVNLEMIWVEPGTFSMGSPLTEEGRNEGSSYKNIVADAETQHGVTISAGFYLGKYEVTQAQYEAVMSANDRGLEASPGWSPRNPNNPLEGVSWYDVQEFLVILNQQQADNLPSGWLYSLPTEAEWEYTYRAGTTTAYPWGDDNYSSYAHHFKSSISEVGNYHPNNWGFYDMGGNAWEWVEDWYGEYPQSPVIDPTGPKSGTYKILRGNGWGLHEHWKTYMRAANRQAFPPNSRDWYADLGFRLAFKKITTTPSNLNPLSALNFAENQPIGTIVGEFNATDPDAGATLTYHLVSGAGDGNNSLFTLETNGTLKTATTFDYETNASTYSIRVQAKDEFNASVEGNFTVVLTDVYEPSQANHIVDLNSTVNLEMIWVEPGTFTMGSPTGETGRNASKEQEHNVTLTKGFYLGKYEVTQAHYEAVMTGNGSGLSATPSSYFGNPNRPVERVSWDDVQIFLTRLNANEQAAGRLPTGWSYVLPTESQWEYACRAGTTTVYSWGNTITSAHANYSSTGIGQTSDVGQYAANPWGFFDMHGNVWEMLSDWYESGYPTDNPSINPEGPVVGSAKVHRGGSFVTGPVDLRSAERHSYNPANVHNTLGFRLAYKQITTAPNNLASTTPLTFAENQPIGTVVSDFNGTDPDAGATLTYYLVSGTGDGNNSLFTLETNGTLKTATTFDYETNASAYSIRVQAKDEFNATVEGNFTVTLTDVYEAPPNTPPTNLNSTAPLTIAENQPVGTIVGEFNATDPDVGASLTFYLVSGAGDGGNSQFSLDANGTLRTATVFDYERNASTYSIRVRVRDNHSSTLDGVFTVTLRDVFENTVPSDLNATASLTIAENQPVGTIVGGFNATDPDAGASLTYYLVSGSGDGGNSNFSLDANGTLRTATVFDYERNASTYSIRVRVKDNHSSTLEGVFTVRLTDQDDGPSGLVPLATLSVAENEPAGTVVGEFKTSVPVAGMQVSYRLVAGDGDSDNAYFVMDPDGTLKTAYPFDYESDPISYSIRVRAEEPTGAGVEKIFQVRLRDVLVPVVETGGASMGGSASATEESLVLEGRILVAGGGAGVTDRGILFSSKPNPSFPGRFFSAGAGEGVFQVRTSRVEPGRKYYYRAYATNAEGTSYGLEESFRTIEKGTKPGWVLAERTNGQNVDEYTYLGEHGRAPNWTGVQAGTMPNWWKSDLMGTFFQAPNGWALHPDFGWFYPVRSQSGGVWLWKRNLGWFWTDMGLYPRLYRSNSQGWVYFYGVWQGRKLFYDYASGKWTTIEEQ